jgi:DNA invertase Pin-like site-specific DNA recombinase
MTNADRLPVEVLKRKAVVYVRQSTQAQVQMNLESQRRQYDLVGEAKDLGFRDIEIIDDDLGRSASGTVARPGFEKLVAWLCAGEVGAVLCLDASRLARNGRLASFAGALRSGSGPGYRSGRGIRSVSSQ